MIEVLVLCEDRVGAQLGGNAIRAVELARTLSAHANVILGAPLADEGPPSEDAIGPRVRCVSVDRERPRALRRLLKNVDVVVSPPPNPVVAAELRRSNARIVYDLYDPKPLQFLEALSQASRLARHRWAMIALDHVLEALSSGDFLICATERQRDLWIGGMLSRGLITPAVYQADPSLRQTIDVVPFGVPTELPQRRGEGPRGRFPAIAAEDEIVIWNGGLWNWLDPICAVDAVAIAVESRQRTRLVFMGRGPSTAEEATAADAAKRRAAELGLLDRIVFFNDSWVDYDERAAWLLDSDCALSLHTDHLETRYSFRTRLLDCFWAGLPIVCTEGDELADRVHHDRLGVTVPPSDPRRVAGAIIEVLERGRSTYGAPLAKAAEDHRWPAVVAPLIRYVLDPSPLHRRASFAREPARLSRATAIRASRGALRPFRRLS